MKYAGNATSLLKAARTHYENFTVVSPFLPRSLQRDIAVVYAYCRTVDDIGDEAAGNRADLLNEWEDDLRQVWAGKPRHTVLQLLQGTVARHKLPRKPFFRLVEANRRDQVKNRYDSWAELLDYCGYSANPVGRIYLALLGVDNEELLELSDAVCTALQLTNFWQDISRDAAINRIYIPQAELRRAQVTEEDIIAGRDSLASAELIANLADYTKALYRKGSALPPFLPPRYAAGVRLFIAGGLAMLNKVHTQKATALSRRPALSRWEKAKLVAQALFPAAQTKLEMESYDYCDRLTRQEAGNFRFAIATLPKRRRQAMCAIYAYCRVADDAADLAADRESAARNIRHIRRSLEDALAGRPEGPLMTALTAARARFPIPAGCLADVLNGVEQDLYISRYADFTGLQQYCRLVAGAVGQLCLGVFGVRQQAARAFADDLGYAMQITNILRDVREDIRRDRIYIPKEDMDRFAVSEADLHAEQTSASCRALFEFEAERARSYYQSARRLFALVPRRSRMCLLALFMVYEELLNEIRRRKYEVLADRIALTSRQKVALAGKVWWCWLWSGM